MNEQQEQNSLFEIENGYKEELAGIMQESNVLEPEDPEICTADLEELAEAINDIRDKVSSMDNDIKHFMQSTNNQLIDICNDMLSIMTTLKEMNDLPKSLQKMNDNISGNVTNLQSALNQINSSTKQCLEALRDAAGEIPQKLLEDCNRQNKSALDVAVANFNSMNAASQKWIKQLGNHTDWATQIVIVSGVLTPILLLLMIYMLLRIAK